MKASVRANAIVQVSIPCNSVWGEECSMGQVRKQALDSFREIIEKINSPCVQDDVKRGPVGIKIIGKPLVEMVILEPEK